ncbi:MAG: hypothetical protein AB7Y46_16935 [Armatimonadota bacterium]
MRETLIVLATLAVAMPAIAQRPSNITRGVYVHSRDLMPAFIWSAWGSGFQFDADNPHSGQMAIRCENLPGGQGQGASQTVQVNQTEARPLKIAGWSRAEGVEAGGADWQYSIYVDLRYADGTPLHMQIASFERGSHDWQYSETIIEPDKPIVSASYHVFIRNIGGTVWFDDLFFGEPEGENLLRIPGFESDEMADDEGRARVLADLAAMHVNAVHTYIELPDSKREQEGVRDMLAALAAKGIGVVLTPHIPYGTFANADDPAFPAYACVNGEWGDRWVATVASWAQYPFMGISVVPDEYNWNTGRLRQAYANHADERVREFYANLPNYCNCPACQERFMRDYGMPLPPMGQWSRIPEQSEAYRNFIDFRYRCTTDLIRRAVDAVHSGPFDTAADSLICVSPICSDFRLGTGVAWDMVGYGTDIDYPTTDPYILLHNYLGDSTHWYVTETTMHLVGSTPKRQCGIVLEGTQLRPEHRALLPVEIYGSALSSVARGAKEIGFFHYVHLMQQTAAGQAQGDSGLRSVRGCFDLLQRIDPWLEGAEPVKRVALLYSRASEELFSFYTHPQPDLHVLTHDTDDPRYPFLAQKEVLYYLLRAGVPTDLYYLDQVSAEELADYEAIVIPFPFAVSEQQAAMLEGLAEAGKFLLVISEFGSVDEHGVPYERPVLLDLLGLAEAPSGTQTGPVTASLAEEPIPGEFSVYASVTPAEGTRVGAWIGSTPAAVVRPVADGVVVFLAGEFGIGLPASRDNELRDRTVRILPAELSEGHARALGAVFGPAALADRRVPADDVELALMRNAAGDYLLFAINWEEQARAVTAFLPADAAPTGAGFALHADGNVADASVAATDQAVALELAPQEALVLRFAVP